MQGIDWICVFVVIEYGACKQFTETWHVSPEIKIQEPRIHRMVTRSPSIRARLVSTISVSHIRDSRIRRQGSSETFNAGGLVVPVTIVSESQRNGYETRLWINLEQSTP